MLGIFLDSETNGLNPQKHRLLEIAYKILDLSTGKLEQEYQSILSQTSKVWEQSDVKSLEINGFTKDLLSQGKKESIVAKEILDSFEALQIGRKNAIFICQNPSFDRIYFSQLIPFEKQDRLLWPYHWLDLASMYWATTIHSLKKNKKDLPTDLALSKDSIAAVYHLPSEEKPHRAMNGVNHLILCYEAIVGFPGKTS
jgi:DNA polymerase-3 subunit epsilon/oligoribonuclease